jgi:hypothetical protein
MDAPRLHSRPRRLLAGTLVVAGVAVAIYVLTAYVLLPGFWILDTRRTAFRRVPRVTQTADGIPGDPLNIGLQAGRADLVKSLLAAGWHPADPITLDTALHIAESAVFRRAYADAPVSNLYLFGRKEDLAFERPVGGDPRRRHHVRFWELPRAPESPDELRPLWVGAATFDVRVGLSHTTGQITHHISPDVDAERDKLLSDLQQADRVQEVIWIDDFHEVHSGTNGGGDPWLTDGELALLVLVLAGSSS